jgi:hypothetical protein
MQVHVHPAVPALHERVPRHAEIRLNDHRVARRPAKGEAQHAGAAGNRHRRPEPSDGHVTGGV